MTTRTPSTIAAELEAAFVSGQPPRELLVLIRELRQAIDSHSECPECKTRRDIMNAAIDATCCGTSEPESFQAYQNRYYANNLRQ